jgi:hypothetical protein
MQSIRLVAAAAAIVSVGVPAAAVAKNKPGVVGTSCSVKSATLAATRGHGTLLDFNQNQPDGGQLIGDKLKFPGHFFKADGIALTLSFGKNTYDISAGSVFKLGCYGQSKGGPLYPAINQLVGKVEVHADADKPGGVMNEEGLYNPVGVGTKMHYTITRTLARSAPPAFDDMMGWFGNLRDQPTGTTNVKSNDARVVNITPYVGATPGTCMHATSARLRTNGTYGKGTAKYGTR